MPEVPTTFPDQEPGQQSQIAERLDPSAPSIADRLEGKDQPDTEESTAQQSQQAEAARQAIADHQPGPTFRDPTEAEIREHRARAEHGGFVPGEAVKVLRSPNSGSHIEDGWRVLGKDTDNPDPAKRGNLLVGKANANGDTMTKSLPAADLHQFQDQPVSEPFYNTQSLPENFYAQPVKRKRGLRNLFGLLNR